MFSSVCVLRRAAFIFAVAFALAGVSYNIADAESGMETYTPANAKPNPMSGKDVLTLLGKSLGKKFQDLIVVNGGCYTAGFSDAAASSDLATSGNNVAFMAATDAKCPREESQGTADGNSFLQGLNNGFSPALNPNNEPGTVTDAFNGGKARVSRDVNGKDWDKKEAQTPTLTVFGGGAQIQLGKKASSYHAVLFAGKPTTCFDWKDIYDTYQNLLASGYDASNIQVLFGSGNRGQDGSPQLLKDDGTDGATVSQKNQDTEHNKGCKYEMEVDKDGKQSRIRLQPATHANFKKVLTDLQVIATKSATEQYFVWTGTHNTGSADSQEVSYSVPPQKGTATGTNTVPVSTSTPNGGIGQQYATLIPGGGIPGENVSYFVPFATDSTTYCTFGEGTGVPGYYTSADDSGNTSKPVSYGGTSDGIPASTGPKIATGEPVIPSGKPAGDAVTPGPSETPTAMTTDGPHPVSTPDPKPAATPQPADTPMATTTDKPETPATTSKPDTPSTTDKPDTPAMTDKPDTPTTTDTPQTPDTPVHVTIFIKASEAVLDGGQTGDPIQGQVVKLVMREKPPLRTAENTSTTQAGSDKPAPQCTTGADGQCKIDVPSEDRPLYALNQTPRISAKPVSNFQLAFNLMKHSGGIVETTGKKLPDLKDSMSSGNLTAEPIKIGSRTFVRLGFNTPYGATGDLVEKFSKLFGVPVEIDICLVKEPGPPLGSEPASYEALNQELPHAALKLRTVQMRASNR